ncbi:hypothetical protein DH2020_042388 [Rehmannia glutinosa]|uniref:non-specific serine/threonine protein kinase n=1 Tax=Rehmannia glutinosa TaxID=99300 RepID=A0ABR0UMI3_REHGL
MNGETRNEKRGTRAINAIFAQWRISAGSGWNISGELCTGIASDNVTALDFSPGIKCDCFYNSGTICHIYSLNLAQNYLTGPLSPSVGNLTRLQYLSLSINSLSGELPKELGKLTDLRSLAVSTNNFSGNLPSELGNCRRLEELFASDNALTGRIPDFIGNSSFAIKCGGPQVRSATGIVHEADNATLGPAAYYVTRARRWAVSNVGLPMNNPNPEFETTYLTYIPNTRDPELFQTARLSAGSLRYYGLGLQNGGYNVSLQFVETKFENTMVWKSLGRRVFDIYIQGNLAWKDFDIRKEGDGASLRAVVKDFTARVTENHLEIHLFWAGKGTCCVPAHGTYGPSISAISVTPADFIPTVSNNPPDEPANKKNRAGMIVGIVVSIGVLSFLSLFAFYYSVQRRKRQKSYEDQEFLGIEARPYTFGYAELKAATDDFSMANKLGEGGFGPVYKGTLEDGRIVAVKQLSVASRQGKSQFVAEIATISAVQHRNLVKLYGCCIEGDKRLLVYEYLENKSLDQALFGNKSLFLNWPTRYEICLGVARGLAYLHEESRLRIVHRDVKASNILLDSQLNPKISDFGLAKLYDYKMTHISTRVAGTIGYLAPEYAMRGHLTEKADVFGFGVVTLEVICGRANSDSSLEGDGKYLLEWAWDCHENKREMELVDPNLSEFNEDEVQKLIGVALLCSQTSPVARPSMSRVVAMLSGDAEVPTVTTRPGYLSEWNFNDTSTFVMDTDNPISITDQSPYEAASSTTTTASPLCSPNHASEPMLRGEKRE